MDESDEVVDESKVTKSYKKSCVKIIIIKVGTRKNTFHDRYLKKKHYYKKTLFNTNK